jgi:hypothetical protein
MDAKQSSKVIVVVAFGEGQVLLCEKSRALDFIRESGGSADTDGFVPEKIGVALEAPSAPGVYVGVLRIVDGGPESWELSHIRDYYAEICDLRPITSEEWNAHLSGEWPEGFAS